MGVDIDIGAPVYGADGHEAGKVSGVVMNPGTDEAVAVVVRGDGVAPLDKVVPMAAVARVEDHRVILNVPAREVGHMPDLDERDYIPLEFGPSAQPETWGERRLVAPTLVTWGAAREPYVEAVWRSIPDYDMVIREGLPVYTRHGVELGRVDELVTDPASGLITYIVVRAAESAHDKAIPIAWIARYDEDSGITLAVDAIAVDALPDYH